MQMTVKMENRDGWRGETSMRQEHAGVIAFLATTGVIEGVWTGRKRFRFRGSERHVVEVSRELYLR